MMGKDVLQKQGFNEIPTGVFISDRIRRCLNLMSVKRKSFAAKKEIRLFAVRDGDKANLNKHSKKWAILSLYLRLCWNH